VENKGMTEVMLEASTQDKRERAAIDRSERYPVLFFFISAAGWLCLASLLGFVAAAKLMAPGMWGNCPWLSYGRLFPAHMDALIYGWGMQAGFGVMIWLMARLCRVEVKNAVTLIVAGNIWNVAVLVGVVAVWGGQGNSLAWLDFPAYLWPALFLTYAVISGSLMMMFRRRRKGDVYVSQRYIFGAALWFPWIYATANLLIHHTGGSALMDAGVNAWYMSGLVYLWFVPVGLASIYYLLPKIMGRQVYSYQLAQLGFWALAILAGWMGFNRFQGGPFPSWMPAISGAAVILMLLPVLAVAVNCRGTIAGRFAVVMESPALSLTLLGGAMFICHGLLSAAMSFFGVSRILQFTYATVGIDTMALYGFFTLVMSGAIYFIVPRICARKWPSDSLIGAHFWLLVFALIMVVGFTVFGGVAQGVVMDNWSRDLIDSIRHSNGYVMGWVVGWALVLAASLVFCYQLGLMFLGGGREAEDSALSQNNTGEGADAEVAGSLAKGEAAKA